MCKAKTKVQINEIIKKNILETNVEGNDEPSDEGDVE